MDLLKEVGAIAGLASFLGLALLALLYFAQARDIRRLRENASFLVEGNADGETVAPAERTATAVAATTTEPEEAAAAAAAAAPSSRARPPCAASASSSAVAGRTAIASARRGCRGRSRSP